MKKLFIAIPSYKFINIEAVHCMFSLLSSGDDNRMLALHGGEGFVGRSRNQICSKFLESDFTDLLMIDSDIIYTPQNVDRIASHDVPIVAGFYPKKAPGKTVWVANHLSKSEKVDGDGLIKVETIGTGFIKIQRQVLEKMRDSGLAARYIVDGTDIVEYEFFPFRVVNGRLRSEDWAFPLHPDTKLLGSDYRWKQVGDIQIGDRLLGVDESSTSHSSRRYSNATVTAVIRKILPVWRIVTEDREIFTTADHPWLVRKNRGVWNWIRTDQITEVEQIARVTPVVTSPDLFSSEYRSGYLQGVMQGDGHIRKEDKAGALVMCDTEALYRFAHYLDELNLPHADLIKIGRPKKDAHRQTYGITFNQMTAKYLRQLRDHVGIPNRLFAAGYLGGIFDAEGHFDGATIDIHNRKRQILDRIEQVASMLGFTVRTDDRRVRLSGIEEVQRFWMETSPAILRKVSIKGQNGNREAMHCKTPVLSVEDTGRIEEVMCVTTTTGTFVAEGFASHNCDNAHELGIPVYGDSLCALRHLGTCIYPTPEAQTIERALKVIQNLQGQGPFLKVPTEIFDALSLDPSYNVAS